MPVIFDCLLLSQSAVGAVLRFDFDVIVNGQTIGKIDLEEATGLPTGRGLAGSFSTQRTGRTISQLLGYIGTKERDRKAPAHLNWLQVVTKSIYPASGPGRPQANFIDPIKDGFSTQLSDSEPWYYDEYIPRPLPNKDPYDRSYLRTYRTTDFNLSFEDIVRQPPGTQLTFNTFLIAAYGDRTYRPLGNGFQWSIQSEKHPRNSLLGVVKLASRPTTVSYNPSLFDKLVSAFGYTRRQTPLNQASTPRQAASGLVASSGGCGLNLGGSCPSGYSYTDPIGGGRGGFGDTQAGVGFSDDLSTVNPGESTLRGSQQAGISEYVGNKDFWFNYSESATCSAASGASGGCDPALATNIASQPMLMSSIADSNAPNAKNLSGQDNEDDALAAEAVPEPTTVLGGLLAACGLATLKKLKKGKLIQP
jgi:hypothetical protein